MRWLCEALDVSRSGFDEWLTRPPARRTVENGRLMRAIRTSVESSDRTYGSPRVWRDLREEGARCGRHRVARLMRAAGLKARPTRRRRPSDTGIRPEHLLAPNLLQRPCQAAGLNQRWVADVTYVWTAEGWLYVAVVLDLCSRRVVGWSMSATMTAQLVIDALLMAGWRRGRPTAVLHHSDQGSQYTSEDFRRLLADQGIVCRMSRRGDCWDNAAMERFFSTLKIERVPRHRDLTRNEARADLFDSIERFSNPRRRHSTLGQIRPAEFEKRFPDLLRCP